LCLVDFRRRLLARIGDVLGRFLLRLGYVARRFRRRLLLIAGSQRQRENASRQKCMTDFHVCLSTRRPMRHAAQH